MKKYLYLLIGISCLYILGNGCREYNSEQQQLWDEVMLVHDEVMPKMGELHQLKKQLEKLEASSTNQVVIQEIEGAQDAMMDWMRGFQPMRKVAKMDHSTAIAYLKKEHTTILEVKKRMLDSLKKGQALVH